MLLQKHIPMQKKRNVAKPPVSTYQPGFPTSFGQKSQNLTKAKNSSNLLTLQFDEFFDKKNLKFFLFKTCWDNLYDFTQEFFDVPKVTSKFFLCRDGMFSMHRKVPQNANFGGRSSKSGKIR